MRSVSRRSSDSGKTMNEPPRVELHSSIRARSASVPIGRKLATAFLAMFIVSVMIVWFGSLGWGVVALVKWIWNHIRSMW
jgi:hypothetical protein